MIMIKRETLTCILYSKCTAEWKESKIATGGGIISTTAAVRPRRAHGVKQSSRAIIVFGDRRRSFFIYFFSPRPRRSLHPCAHARQIIATRPQHPIDGRDLTFIIIIVEAGGQHLYGYTYGGGCVRHVRAGAVCTHTRMYSRASDNAIL